MFILKRRKKKLLNDEIERFHSEVDHFSLNLNRSKSKNKENIAKASHLRNCGCLKDILNDEIKNFGLQDENEIDF